MVDRENISTFFQENKKYPLSVGHSYGDIILNIKMLYPTLSLKFF